MRKFYIEADGVRIPLNGENGIWFSNPEGLGVTNNNSFGNLKKGFFMGINTDEFPQNSVTGDLVFVRNAYEKYRQFVNSLLMAGELILVYMPESTEYKRKVQINFINKSEMKNARWLTSACSFSCLTPWFTKQALTGTSISVTAAGQLPSAFEISLTGATTAVTVALGEIGKVQLFTALTATDVLNISTVPTDSHVLKNNVDVIADVDITANPYFKLPQGQTATLTASDGTMNVNVFHYWRSI